MWAKKNLADVKEDGDGLPSAPQFGELAHKMVKDLPRTLCGSCDQTYWQRLLSGIFCRGYGNFGRPVI